METSVFQFSDYKEILLSEFQNRLKKEARYSMRAFSRDLGLRSAAMNDVLAGRYGLSAKTATVMAEKIGLSGEESLYFVSLVEMKHGRSFAVRDLAEKRVRKLRGFKSRYEFLETETLDLFSHWFQPAILELITIFEGKITEKSVAKSLGLSTGEAREGLENLQRIGLISKRKDLYVRITDFVSGESSTPHHTIRDYHRQVMMRSLAALETQPIQKRKFLTTVFSCDSSAIAQCRADLDLLHDQVVEKYQTEKEADSVYVLALQLVRLDQ